MIDIAEDVVESGLLKAPENRLDFEPYDIYRKLTQKERRNMERQIQSDTVKFAAELDEKILPIMPNTKHSTTRAKRHFLGIIAERQARLQAQNRWMREQQEYYRSLAEE